MVKYKKIVAIALAASLGAASSAAVAQGMHQGGMMGGQGGMGAGMMMGGQGGMGFGMMPDAMMGGMGTMFGMSGMLDEQQRSTMREMRQEHRAVQLERMGEMMNLRDDMMQLMQAERPDPEEVKALHGQMASLHGDMLADNVRLHNQMQDLLTDEQRKQMREAMPRYRGLQ
ncbi:hypothetical protein GLV89_02390 [Halomonas alkaliantarctica]|nr:hypothetical protein [Halomonas alkaliantarctica]